MKHGRLIDADALKEYFFRPYSNEESYSNIDIGHIIDDQPTVNSSTQPEQKIGKFVRWMEKRETPKYISYTPHCKCSLCGNEFLIENINYCYMCGARLIEDRWTERRE